MSNRRGRHHRRTPKPKPPRRGWYQDGGEWVVVCLDPFCPDFGIHQVSCAPWDASPQHQPRTARGPGGNPDPSANRSEVRSEVHDSDHGTR